MMKKSFYPAIVFITTCLFHFNAKSQCSTTPCNTPQPAVNAMDACILPSPDALNCYIGSTTSDPPVSFPPSWCSVIHNNHVFAFTATSSTVSFDLATISCSSGPGIQAAILSSSDCINFNFESACIGNIPFGNSVTLTSTTLVPGQVYFLMIDGTSSAICDYSINASPAIYSGPTQVCIPAQATAVYNASQPSTWYVNPPTAGTFVGSPSGTTQVTINWQQAGTAQVCATNDKCPFAPPSCIDVQIGLSSASAQNVQLCQGKTVVCGGQTYSAPGVYTNTYANWLGCDSIVTCNVTLIPTINMPMVNVNKCGPATHQICNNVYNSSGIYAVTCTNWQGCDSIVNVNLTILEPDAQIAPPLPIDCDQNEFVYLDGSGSSFNLHPGGTTAWQWTGPGIIGANNQIAILVDKPGTYCLTVTHSYNGFSCADNTCVNVIENKQVPATPQVSGPLTVCSGSTANYSVTPNGIVNPTGYTWTVPAGATFTNVNATTIAVNWGTSTGGKVCVTADNNCGSSPQACVTVQVSPAPTAVISGSPSVCPNSSAQGNLTITLTGGGPWTVGYNLNSTPQTPLSIAASPHTLMGGAGTYVLTTVTNAAGCTGTASGTGTVNQYTAPTAALSGNGTICQGSGQQASLTITLTGTGPWMVDWSSGSDPQGTLTITTSPYTLQVGQTLAGNITLTGVTDANGCVGTVSGSSVVSVLTSPTTSGLQTVCDATSTTYTVSFNVNSGDPASYAITPPNGTFTGNMFTSNPIVSGDPYSFVVSDANNCNQVTLSGAYACNCTTNAGTMSATPLAVCVGETVDATHDGNEVLDANDILYFVLHSGNGNSLGTVYATNSVPQFNLVPPMMPGVSYYISAVAGNSNGSGGVLQGDPCLSVSVGTEVVFNPLPTASIGGGSDICAGESISLTFALTGNPPFDVTYSNGTQNFTLNNINNGHLLPVSPGQNTTYSLVSVNDSSNPACSATGGNSTTVPVWQAASTNQSVQICEGESVMLGGAMQTVSGIYYDTLATVHGCDSVLMSTLTVRTIDSVFLAETSCNPANLGTFIQSLTNIAGCDSTVVTTVTFSQSDTTLLSAATCDPAGVGVFSETFITPDGCDSIVITSVSLLPSDTTYLSDATCDAAGVGVFTQNLVNQNGCDSTVVTTVSLLASDTTALFDSSCNPANVGVFIQNLLNQNGCDSTVITTVNFSQTDSTFLTGTTCDPAAAGVFTQDLTTPDGCDSTVITTVSLLPSNQTPIFSTTCEPAATGVFVYQLTNQYGCDSTVTETVSLLPSDTTYLTFTTCDASQAGTTFNLLSNQFGCDSLIVSTTSLLPPSACGISASLTGSTIPCTALSGSITLTVGLGQAPYTYVWAGTGNPPSGSGTISATGAPEVINGLSAGNYSVTVTSANGLTTTAQAIVDKLNPPVLTGITPSNYNGFNLSCVAAADGTATANATGAAPFTYLWSNGAAGQQAANLPAGSYSVTVTDANGCTVTGSVSLTQPPPLEITFTVNNLDCFGQNDGAIFVDVTGGAKPYRYALNDGDFQNGSSFLNMAGGTYKITAQDANGCEVSEIIGINAPIPLDVELGDNQLITLGDNFSLNAIVNLPFDSLETIIWTGIDTVECPTCLTQNIVPLFTTTYAVSITATNGCTDKDNITIAVDRRKHVYVPNAFSPNNDGVNDKFMIFAKPGTVAKVKSFLVFNRWGETVWQFYDFPPSDPESGWDGVHRGQTMNPAVFTWFAEIEFIDGVTEVFKGSVSLMR